MREETNCRHYETPWFRKGKSKPNKNQAKQQRYANLPPDLRFVSRKNSKTTPKKGQTNNQKYQKKHRISLGHGGKTQRVLSTAQKRVKSCATVKSSNKLAKFYCQAIHYGSHLRVLSDVLFQSSRRLIIAKKDSVYILQKATGIYRQVTALSSDPCGSVSCLQQCRPKREQDCGPRQISCRYKTATLCSLDWPTYYTLLRLLGRSLFARLFFVPL